MTRDTRIAAILALLVWFGCAWFGANEGNPNNVTRLAAASSLVEDGDATIDEWGNITIDKASFGGHLYMDKAPGMTLMALPWVWVADRASGDRAGRHDKIAIGDGIWRYLRIRLRLAAAFGPAILAALAAAALFGLGTALGGSRAAGLFAALGFALGTPVWGWSTSLFGHGAVASLLVIAVWAICRATERDSLKLAAVAGAALGWATVIELQSLLWIAVVAVWALWRVRRELRRAALVGAAAGAGVVLLLPLFAYNQFAFGTPFRLGYQGVVGFAGMQRGIFGLAWPDPGLVPKLLFGLRRGLLWVAPIMFVAPFGLAWLIRRPGTRALGLMAGAITVTALLYNSAYVYWDGGASTGPRHMVPMLGLLALGLAPVWAMLERGWERVALAALLGVSIALNLMIAAADVTTAEAYTFPVWERVIRDGFLKGDTRAVASEWLGWPTQAANALYAVVAVAAIAWLIREVRLADRA